MITISIFITFLAFYVLYNTSQKIGIQSNFGVEQFVQQHILPSKLAGFIFLLLSLMLFISNYGIGVGSLFFFITLMTIGSLVFLLYPLKLITYKTVLESVVFCFIVEYFLL